MCSDKTVLITGANRGLGLEFVRQYLEDGHDVIACARNLSKAKELSTLAESNRSLSTVELDVADFETINKLGEKLKGHPIDLLINNAGVFGPKIKADKDPRQSLGHMDYDLWADIFRINAMAPLKLIERLYDNISNSQEKKIINLSSAVASIATGMSELFAYRTSKAALNVITKILSDKTAETGVICTAFSPGWVKTDMGGPDAEISVVESITVLRATIDKLTEKDSGTFLNYDGRIIPW